MEKSNKIGKNLKINNDFKNKLSLGVDIEFSKEGKQDVGSFTSLYSLPSVVDYSSFHCNFENNSLHYDD